MWPLQRYWWTYSRTFYNEGDFYRILCVIWWWISAAVLVDSIVRLIPGVLNDETSALTDSFQDGLLSPPVYTRPAEYNGMKVPEILLSGDFGEIDKWREDKAIERTKKRRPDLLK